MSSTIPQARQFLARVMAWPQDGDIPAYVNIHNKFIPEDTSTLRFDKDGEPILPWSGIAARSLDQAVRAVENNNNRVSTTDIYFCTSTQIFAEQKTSSKGFSYFKAVRSSENAVKSKVLYIDSDLKGGDHGYSSPAEFGAAFKQFIADTGLPRPTIMVNSGGGFHIYWVLLEGLTAEEWMPLAYALAEATKRHGFRCDTQCTIDISRVLRVPDTLNYKYDPPRKVTILGNPLDFDYLNSKISTALEPYKVPVPISLGNPSMSLLPPRSPLQGVSDLAAGIDTSAHAPVQLDSLVLECGFIAEALATGGANFTNPLWNLTTLISTFTENGRGDAHRMASGHSNYGPGETDELYDRKVQEKLTKNMGWPKCATISASGCASCAGCPHFKEQKSPLNFGQRMMVTLSGTSSASSSLGNIPGPTSTNNTSTSASASTSSAAHVVGAPQPGQSLPVLLIPGTGQADPDLPQGYLRNADGVILYSEQLPDGTSTWLPVSRYAMFDPWMQRDPWSINFTTRTEFGRLSQVSIPTRDVGTGEMKKAFQEQGFMISNGQRGFNLLADFIMSWISKLQETKDSIIQSVPFGWLVRGGKTHGFVFGGKLHTPAGTEVASNTDPELSRQFSPTGERHHWINAAAMVTDQKRPALDALIASAFGAPLVRFTGHNGLLMSAFSVESGIGKSTALKVAQAVWGDPVKAVQSLSDTQNSVLNKLGELRSLPIYWDELKSEDDTKRFVDTVFRLTLGKEKSRMTSKVTQRTPGTWQTIMVSASNDSLMDTIAYKTRATTAGLYRVFEFTVRPAKAGSPGQIDPTVAQRTLAKLNDNFGIIGEEYASYLGSNHAAVEADMATMMSNIATEIKMNADERFWVALIGCTLLGARYSNHLGFTAIDETALKNFLYATLAEMRSTRAAQPVDMRNVVNVVNVLAQFFNQARSRHTLTTNIIHKGRGKAPTGTISLVGDHVRLESVHVHIGVQDKIVRVGKAYLTQWLRDNSFPSHVIIKAIEEELKGWNVTARLGAGTSYAGAAEYLIEINLSGTPLMNFIDEA